MEKTTVICQFCKEELYLIDKKYRCKFCNELSQPEEKMVRLFEQNSKQSQEIISLKREISRLSSVISTKTVKFENIIKMEESKFYLKQLSDEAASEAVQYINGVFKHNKKPINIEDLQEQVREVVFNFLTEK